MRATVGVAVSLFGFRRHPDTSAQPSNDADNLSDSRRHFLPVSSSSSSSSTSSPLRIALWPSLLPALYVSLRLRLLPTAGEDCEVQIEIHVVWQSNAATTFVFTKKHKCPIKLQLASN